MTRPPRLAVISYKGGVGKTSIAVALAALWAQQRGPVTLFDTDPQSEGSATEWLNATTDNLPGLEWQKITGGELANEIRDVVTPVIIDTPPAVTGSTVAAVARLADFVLIPGSIFEWRTIALTAGHIRSVGRPFGAVFTKTLHASQLGARGTSARSELTEVGIPVLGSIRRSTAVESAILDGLLPTEIRGDMAEAVATDLADLFATVTTRLEIPAHAGT